MQTRKAGNDGPLFPWPRWNQSNLIPAGCYLRLAIDSGRKWSSLLLGRHSEEILDFSHVMPNHRELLLTERRGCVRGRYKILTRSEVELNCIAEREKWVRHKSTAFLTRVGPSKRPSAVVYAVGWIFRTMVSSCSSHGTKAPASVRRAEG